ncbi:hypothetical protein K469DRAFT_550796 [Zopfia rhizophila CBS 207.26]|uniref:C3H1-type domain-containing protein n=1 Tax=Zopfia rhizophila CBS 207.26 TaxID=1314779 RepID=A0A6A6EUC8_9PEZI|nr:hypothetical protein K469DRAFT_550796 [Zopfia rhizophila CBS 207.26]
MASNHVPNDRLPMQGQSIYTDPNFDNLFGGVEQYNTPAWNPNQLNHHSGLVPQGVQTSSPGSWHHNSFSQHVYNPINQPYGPQSHGYQATPPFQYGQYGSHGPVSSYSHSPAVDPSLVDPMAIRARGSPYQMDVRNPPPPQGQAAGTVAPQALQQSAASLPNVHKTASPFQIPKTTTEMFSQSSAPTTLVMQMDDPKYDVPKGKVSGCFSVIEPSALAKATKSSALNKFVNVGKEPLNLAINRTALPQFHPRQSVNDLKKLGAGNKKLLMKLAKKSSSKISALLKGAVASKTKIGGAGSPSALKREVSDSESYTESSDNESDYSTNDDEPPEPSPLPPTRPEEPDKAVRYDMIKATWFPRKSAVGTEKVRTSLHDFWEVLGTIQKRWITDTKAVTDAEAEKKTGDLPVLKSRVKSQLDLLEIALKTTLEYGHPDILYNLGHVKPFLFLCYRFLANRHKVQDFNGALPTVIFEILARCKETLTSEILEETRVTKALNSLKKSANDQNKALIQQIIDGAAVGSKKAKVSSPPQEETPEPKDSKRTVSQPAGRASSAGPVAKSKIAEPAQVPTKKATTTTTPKNATTTSAATQKRPGDKAAPAPAKARGNQVVNKPSTFFSTLNAATKKPTPAASTPVTLAAKSAAPQKITNNTPKDKKPAPVAPVAPTKPSFSFAETLASIVKPKEEPVVQAKPEKQLPPETPEEKTKRLRKESRRHLRVSFRPDTTLVSIRYFHHDPEEEIGHDESLVRDAGDIGGEGRMFKQHKDMMDYEDDDDELEQSYRPWIEPSRVDFSVVNEVERQRNFEPYGGGELKPACPEKEANQRRENSTLMVFYTHPSDIPSSPREPLEPPTQTSAPVIEFGAPHDWVLNRAPKEHPPAPANDFGALEALFKAHSTNNTAPQPAVTQSAYTPQPAASNTPDISVILSALSNASQQQAPAPQQPAPVAQPAAGLDLAALLANLGQAATSAPTYSMSNQIAWPFAQTYPQQQQAQNNYQQPQHNDYSNEGGKRGRDDGNHNERDYGSFKKHRGNKNHQGGPKPHKVLPCKYFRQGKCIKGDDCTYIHDRN